MAVAFVGSVEAARREWRARLDANASHQEQCDAYTVDLPCAGCALFLGREQAAYRAYYVAKMGGTR